MAIKRLKEQSPEQQVQFLKEMAILRACRGSRYVVNFVGASLYPVRRLFWHSTTLAWSRPVSYRLVPLIGIPL